VETTDSAAIAAGTVADSILREDGFYLLREDGGRFLRE